MNRVCLLGRLCADPVIRDVGTRGQVADFTLAVDRQMSKEAKERAKQTADFIKCNAWGEKAKFVGKFLKKGEKIGLDGRIQTSNYENSEGKKIYSTIVNADNFYFVPNAKPKEKPVALTDALSEVDLPF